MKHKPHLSETVKLLEKCVRLPQNLVKKYFFFILLSMKWDTWQKDTFYKKLKL